MCGIAGFVRLGGFEARAASCVLARMTQTIAARGPDDDGYWIDPAAGVAFGHRRLSVVDLSEAGHQPMRSADGRYVIVFNGEIYNHHELREQLPSQAWRGHSDTETLLAGIGTWGLRRCLERSTGMFALALWDRRERSLSLARDRLGEKPLYYGWQDDTFMFGSELKALRAHPQFVPDIDRAALDCLIRKGYVSSPRSIYKCISKLTPGCVVSIPISSERRVAVPEPYWSAASAVRRGLADPFKGSSEDAVHELERLLRQSIRDQMVADVPLGAFLSGGIDSSTVVALMQSQSRRPVKTYTIGFGDPLYDEADHARAVARYLGTEHTEYCASPEDALCLVPTLPQVYDEPFADMSQIPTLLVAQLARKEVTVALSGDGGDELFCGYGRYAQATHAWGKLSQVPLCVRSWIKPWLPPSALKAGIDAANVDAFYRFMNTQWKAHPRLVLGAPASPAEADFPAGLDPKGRMMYSDMRDYLPDDILVKVDRAAMSQSLETRVPLLDHRVVEFAWQLPTALKVRAGVNKWPLKQVLYRHVPATLVDRPKRGFGVPMQHWLRTSLRDWAESLLDADRLKSEGFFDHVAVRNEWASHLSGRKDRHYGLWSILMFQQWLQSTRASAPSPQ